ncbi:MAG: hypothetical protein V4671_05120 [Armatimonadota bacterium]
MSDASAELPSPVPILYVTDLTYDRFDPADLFDIAFLLRSENHFLSGVCLTESEGGGERVLDALTLRVNADVPTIAPGEELASFLRDSVEPLNIVVVGGYRVLADLLFTDQALFREKVARVFLVGGLVNSYTPEDTAERLPTDPRLRQRHPERFSASGDPRLRTEPAEQVAWAKLLTSGESVIWLPRDICLWRYAAPGILENGGALTEWLLRELFWANQQTIPDRYDAADAPVLLSALPALLLAVRPDPFAWMRLFRVLAAHVETDSETGEVTSFVTQTDAPNLFSVIAIDGQALGKMLTAKLRDRPLT